VLRSQHRVYDGRGEVARTQDVWVFKDLGFTSEEASKLKIKVQLMCQISEWIKEKQLKQAGSRYFCESLFWASQPKQAAKT
jgi:hypothetical protein